MQKNNVGDWAWAIYTKIRGIVQKNQIKRLENIVKGTDFHGYISKTDLGYVSGQGYEYIPSHNHAKAFCRYTPISDNDTVIDLGCGKGWAMYLLGKTGQFKHVYGIEKNAELANIAVKNMIGLNTRESAERYQVFSLDVIDALDEKNEQMRKFIDEATVFYTFNSFPRNVTEKVVEGIEKSAERNPRKILFWYVQPDADILAYFWEKEKIGRWQVSMHKKSHMEDIYEFRVLS